MISFGNETHCRNDTTGVSKEDVIINYFFGSSMIIIFATSTFLNPVVFFFHYFQPKQTIVTILFQLLSLSDFFTTTFYPLVVAYNLLKTEVSPEDCPATPFEIFTTVFQFSFTPFSGIVTAVLSITRFIMIRFPFFNLKKHYVLFYIGAMTVISCFPMWYDEASADEPRWENYIQGSRGKGDFVMWAVNREDIPIAYILYWIPYNLNCLFGLGMSIATIVHLYQDAREVTVNSNIDKSLLCKVTCFSIILLNIGNMVLVSVDFALMGVVEQDGVVPKRQVKILSFLCSCFLPVLLAAVNPAIVISRSSMIKKSIRQTRTELVERWSWHSTSNLYKCKKDKYLIQDSP